MSLAKNPNALARFEAEAQTVASLSHPNIVAIFDVGREGEIHYLVMELLEGETRRLDSGPLVARTYRYRTARAVTSSWGGPAPAKA